MPAAVYVCRGCRNLGHPPTPKRWVGPCPFCGQRWAIVATRREEPLENRTLAALSKPETVYIPTGVDGFDRVVGGGLVAGSVILFGGTRGSGKSSLMVAVCDGIAKKTGKPVLYASGEEKAEDVGKIARRLGVENVHIEVMGNANEIYDIQERVEEVKPILTVYDSLQVMTCNDVKGDEGSIVQGVAVANVITSDCKEHNRCAIIINHLTRAGDFAGSMSVEHLVDTIIMLDRDPDYDEEGQIKEGSQSKRVLFVAEKNRNGPDDQRASFVMTEHGLKAGRTKLFTI